MANNWTEHLLIRRICQGDETSLKLLAQVRLEHFPSDGYRNAFQRIQSFYNKRNLILKWGEVIRDSALPEKLRDKLRTAEIKRKQLRDRDTSLALPKDFEGAMMLHNQLIVHSQHTNLVSFQNSLTEKLRKDNPTSSEVQDLISFCTKGITNISSLEATGEKVISIGSLTPTTYIERLSKRLDKIFIPTGFKAFDSQNLGLLRDSLLIISANAGGGKSSIARALANNIYLQGGRVCYVSLEMNLDEHLLRLLSAISGIHTLDLMKDFKKYHNILIKAMTAWYKKDGVATLDFYIPDESVTIPQTLAMLRPYNYDLIILDYVTLFAPTQKEQWNSLDEAGRMGKIFATNNKCIVCMLAQWDSKEDQIRYARALQEHASNLWKWKCDDMSRDQNMVEVAQPKARNQKQFRFPIGIDWNTGCTYDYEGEISQEEEETDNKSKYRKSKGDRGKAKNRNPIPRIDSKNGFDDLPSDADI